jgi:putative SOS response-associated peptidase YedK
VRKGEEKEHRLFAFLTTEANDLVRPIHAKAMPVILREGDWDRWLDADVGGALSLQRPLPAGQLMIVASGRRSDE